MRLTVLIFSLHTFVFCALATDTLLARPQEKEVRVRGTILCVEQSGSPVECTDQSNGFAIQSEHQTYLFLAEDIKAGIFRDARVRSREIEVRGWIRQNNKLEIIRVFSVKENQLFEIQYFCTVCNIKAFVGGLCWCCQEDFEFREVPVKE